MKPFSCTIVLVCSVVAVQSLRAPLRTSTLAASSLRTGASLPLRFKPPADVESDTSIGPLFAETATPDELVGEDSAAFSLAEQSGESWRTFFVAVGGVMSLVFYTWVYNGGPEWGLAYRDLMESLAGGDTTLAITYMLAFFAVVHSGLASIRPYAEPVIGARPWRYVFALASLPLALSSIVYFINHRYVFLHANHTIACMRART
jgi:hypothetical protein